MVLSSKGRGKIENLPLMLPGGNSESEKDLPFRDWTSEFPDYERKKKKKRGCHGGSPPAEDGKRAGSKS